MKLLILSIISILSLTILSCNHYSDTPVITQAVSKNIEWIHDYARCMSYGMSITSMYGSGPIRTDIICAPIRNENFVLEIKNSYTDKNECQINMRRFFYIYGYSVGRTVRAKKSNDIFALRICDGKIYYHSESTFIPSSLQSHRSKQSDDVIVAPSHMLPGAPRIGGGLSAY